MGKFAWNGHWQMGLQNKKKNHNRQNKNEISIKWRYVLLLAKTTINKNKNEITNTQTSPTKRTETIKDPNTKKALIVDRDSLINTEAAMPMKSSTKLTWEMICPGNLPSSRYSRRFSHSLCRLICRLFSISVCVLHCWHKVSKWGLSGCQAK